MFGNGRKKKVEPIGTYQLVKITKSIVSNTNVTEMEERRRTNQSVTSTEISKFLVKITKSIVAHTMQCDRNGGKEGYESICN